MPQPPVSRPPRTVAASLLGLLGFAVAVGIVALVAGLGSAGAGAEYEALEQPAWAPPGWLFSPVWTVLYVTIALAGWLVWRSVGLHRALAPYAVQLVLNAAWPWLFFAAGAYGAAALEIVVLWLAIGMTVVALWAVHRVASLLLLPYWAWTTYAAGLNLAIWALN